MPLGGCHRLEPPSSSSSWGWGSGTEIRILFQITGQLCGSIQKAPTISLDMSCPALLTFQPVPPEAPMLHPPASNLGGKGHFQEPDTGPSVVVSQKEDTLEDWLMN